jgi:hypothetical protein
MGHYPPRRIDLTGGAPSGLATMVVTPYVITATLAIECGELLPPFCVSAAVVASV